MLLECCLLHIDMTLPRYAIFCKFVFTSTSWSNYMIYFSLSFSFLLQLIIQSHKKLPPLVYLDIFAKSSASGCCLAFAEFFANFNLALLLIKKSVYSLSELQVVTIRRIHIDCKFHVNYSYSQNY